MGLTEQEVKQAIQETYTNVTPTGRQVAERFYSPEELAGLPSMAIEMALGVGNPVRAAQLRLGEAVLDLGSGAGIDTFIAARQVGPTGRVIGLDLTPAMLERARQNAAWLKLRHVEFVEGPIEAIPLPDASVGVVISNGVINLSMKKGTVFREIFRVLRPGGRFVVSDLLVNGELPPEVLDNPAAWTG
jgi:SAM-dependent methyltransferase